MSETLRQQLIDTALAMNAAGLNQGTSGNLSVRYRGGMLITPGSMSYAGLSKADIVWMDYEGSSQGERRPSSEWRFHAAIYSEYPQAAAVLHAHPANSTALACTHRSIPAFHYMVAIAGGKDIRCADYATFGSAALSDNVVRALKDRKACLMAHHGMVCFEKDLPATLALAIEVEHLARVYGQILAIGGEQYLDDDEMTRVLDKFSRYGVQDS